ncbi:MAG: class I SAM-dependent methyltransferase [Fidelibacterota bacterium]
MAVPLRSLPFPVRAGLGALERQRGKIRLKPLADWLPPGGDLADIGCGTGAISHLLNQDHRIIPLDIWDLSLFPDIRPLQFDGASLPLKTGSVSSALLMTVLHHTRNPLTLLMEAGRVARQVIVVEDLIHGSWNRRWTFGVDSLLNMEFRGHPHGNASHTQWMRIFRGLGFQVEDWRRERTVLGIQLGYYCLRPVAVNPG